MRYFLLSGKNKAIDVNKPHKCELLLALDYKWISELNGLN
jgi:hypothetical protein